MAYSLSYRRQLESKSDRWKSLARKEDNPLFARNLWAAAEKIDSRLFDDYTKQSDSNKEKIYQQRQGKKL